MRQAIDTKPPQPPGAAVADPPRWDGATPQLQVSLAQEETAPAGILRDLWVRYANTVGTQALTAGFGLVSGLLLPRLLGPNGRGELAAATLWPITLVFLTTLGIDRAAVFFAAKHRQDVSSVASACLALGGAQSLLVFISGHVVIPLALRSYGQGLVRLGLVFLLCAPFVQAANLQSNLFLGRLETRSYNACRAIAPAFYAASVAALFLLRLPSVPAVVALQLLGYAAAAWFTTRFLLRKLRPRWNWDPAAVRDMLKYGAKTHAGQLTYFMNQRLDQLLISLFLPAAQLGIYVGAVAFADALLIIPRAIGAVTLATGSNCDSAGAWRWARRSLLLTFLWLAPASIALWFLTPFVIPRLFGAAFGPSVLPCRILIFGSCAMGFSTVLYEVARSINRPEIPSYAELAGLAVTVCLLAAFLKPYGIIGAAIASTAAYTVTAAFTLGYLLRARVASILQKARRERGGLGPQAVGAGAETSDPVLLVTNMPAPYRIPLWNHLNRLCGGGLKVLFTECRWPHRSWSVPADEMHFNWRFLLEGENPALLNRGIRVALAMLAVLSRSQPRTVISGGYDTLAAWMSFAWCKVFGVRFIMWTESNARDQRRPGKFKEWLKRRIVSASDAIAVPGRAAADYARMLGASGGKISIVRNGFDVDFFARESGKIDRAMEKELHGFPPKLILYSGRLIRLKGVFVLLEAFQRISAELPEVGLLVVGHGPEGSAMQDFCREAGLGQVFFEGPQPYDRMPYFYALADILVLPTFSDSYSYVVTEAFACGVPAVVSRAAGVREDLLVEGRTGLTVEPGDAADVADKVLRVLRDNDLRTRMSSCCREMVQGHTAEYTARRLLGVALARGTEGVVS